MAQLGKAAPKRFHLTAPVVPEDDVHAAIADALDKMMLAPAVFCTIPIGHVQLAPAQAARLARVGVKRGWFDILVIHNGRPYGLEIKRVGGTLSRDRIVATRTGGTRMLEGQVSVFPRLITAGCRIATVTSVDEALTALKEWGIPLRRFS